MTTPKKVGKLFLNKEISIQDLKEGVEFEVDGEENYSDSEDESYFNEDAFKTFKDDMEELSLDQKPKLLSRKNIPFPVFRERMESITSNGKVLKEVLKPGVSIVVPELSVVMVHYDVFLENQIEPFDSTRLRKKPYKFLLGDVGVLPGLELGIKTMKKNEFARFLVGHEYAYGALGCPPRIPPNSDVLFEVELINFYDSKAAIEFDDMAPEEQKKASFEQVVSVYHVESKMANDLFHGKCYKQAIARYRKAVTMLQEISVSNEEEDDKRNSYLLKLHLNLAQSYIHVQNPQKAIIYASMALRIDENNAKGLFRMGYALLQAGDYDRSEQYLTRVKKTLPYDRSVTAALSSLEYKRKQHLGWEKMFCKKALESGASETVKDLCETEEFITVIDKQIKDFLNSDEQELPFSPGYSENQLEVVLKLAKKYNLAFFSKVMNDIKINKVVKTNKTVNLNES